MWSFFRVTRYFFFQKINCLRMAGEVDPSTLLEWLSSGQDEQREMQAMALEHLCMSVRT